MAQRGRCSEYVGGLPTVRVQLRVQKRTEADEQLLHDTINEWLDGANIGSTLAWETCNTKSAVRNLAKNEIKQKTKLGD